MFLKDLILKYFSRSDQDAEGAEVPPEGLGGLVQSLGQAADGGGDLCLIFTVFIFLVDKGPLCIFPKKIFVVLALLSSLRTPWQRSVRFGARWWTA